jgi:hypothetical protein
MFKKVLLTAALAGCATSAFAVTMALDPDEKVLQGNGARSTELTDGIAAVHTIEGLFGETAMTSPNAAGVLTSEVVAGDKITVTYTQPFATGATAAGSLTVSMPGGGGSSLVDTMTISRDGGSAVAGLSSITYTVANVDFAAGAPANGTSANTTVNAVIYTDSTLTFAPCTAACTLKVNMSVSRGDSVIDAAATTALQVASVIKQYTAAATAFNGQVDVGALRKAFVGGGVTDQATITLTTNGGTDGGTIQTVNPAAAAATVNKQEAAATGQTVKLSASAGFGFLDLDTATANVQLTATGKTANVLGGDTDWTAGTISATDVTFTDKAAGTLFDQTDITLDMTSNNTAVIPVNTFSSIWTVAYTSVPGANVGAEAITTAAGAFTMNGSATSVYAVPYGPGVQQYIWLTNEGASTGSITATAFDTSGTAYPTTGEYDLGSIAATSHKAISADLLAKLKADGMDDTVSQRLQIALTVTLPQANVNVYAAYRTGDARLALETSAGKDRQALLATSAALTAVDTVVDAVLVDTAAVDTATAAILVDTGTTLDGIVDTILVDTSDNCFNTALIHAGLDGLAADGTTNGGNVTNFIHNSKISATTLIGSGTGTQAIKDCT